MDIFPLIPDEWLIGYRGRLAASSNCKSPSAFQTLLRHDFPAPEGFSGQSHLLPNLSRALNIPIPELLHRHTMWPLFAAFSEQSARDDPQKSPYADRRSHLWLKNARSRLALCPECVAQDLSSLHFSYWRRSHQLPGLFFCLTHGTSLHFCDPPPFLTARPDSLRDLSKRPDKESLKDASTNGWAQSATTILGAISNATETIPQTRANQLLGLDSGASEPRLNKKFILELSMQASSSFSLSWLKDFMPTLRLAHRNRPISVFMDAALTPSKTGKLSAAATAIVAAHLFTVEEAIQILITADEQDTDMPWAQPTVDAV